MRDDTSSLTSHMWQARWVQLTQRPDSEKRRVVHRLRVLFLLFLRTSIHLKTACNRTICHIFSMVEWTALSYFIQQKDCASEHNRWVYKCLKQSSCGDRAPKVVRPGRISWQPIGRRWGCFIITAKENRPRTQIYLRWKYKALSYTCKPMNVAQHFRFLASHKQRLCRMISRKERPGVWLLHQPATLSHHSFQEPPSSLAQSRWIWPSPQGMTNYRVA